MRHRVASAVVVAAIAAVAILALVDALHPLRPEPVPPLDADAAVRLAELGFDGTLVYTDPDCRVHAISLPDLTPADRPQGEAACEFSLSPDGRQIGPATAHWSPAGTRCDGVCAWRGEELTRAIDGEIRSGAGVLVRRRELERALRAHPTAPDRLEIAELGVRDLAWLSQDLAVALIEVSFPGRPAPENAALVAGFERGRLAWQRVYFGQFERLVVSPGGDVIPEPPPLPFPFLTGRVRLAGPFAWSPDGRGMAVATRASVFVVDLPSERHVRIAVTARDLAWR